MNLRAKEAQQRWSEWLSEQPYQRLRSLYHRCLGERASGTKERLRRCLILWYSCKVPLYPEGHPWRTLFETRARAFLSDSSGAGQNPSFLPPVMSWDTIVRLDSRCLDQYLGDLGITCRPGSTLSHSHKCELLWEAIHSPTGERLGPKSLSKLIVENPHVPLDVLRERYREFRFVSRRQFLGLRSTLRRRGHRIPTMKQLRERRFTG